MSQDDISNYRVSEGDSLDITDGGDRTEDYDVQVMDEQPQLEMGGDAWGNISYISQVAKVGQYEMRTGKQSGETARGDTLSETQNAVVSVHQISPNNGKKLVALTFDDGPAEKYTDAYLDILDQYNIHATFFCLGQNVETYPDLAKKICDRGSEVMSHTYQHQQLTALDASALQQEFSSTFSNIESTTGVKTTGFRPPYGAFSEKAWLNSGGLASVSVLWNQDSLDWKRPGADAIVENCLKNVTSGSIILMHDGGGNRDQDVEALPRIIESLQSQGYEFVTVSDLMKPDSSIPADIAGGDATMPTAACGPRSSRPTTAPRAIRRVPMARTVPRARATRGGPSRQHSSLYVSTAHSLSSSWAVACRYLLRSISFLQALGGRCRAVRNFACTMGGAGSRSPCAAAPRSHARASASLNPREGSLMKPRPASR